MSSNQLIDEVVKLREIELNPPQAEALNNGFLNGGNSVIAWPAGSGKTLMGEIAILQAIDQGKKALYLVPLRALANEKSEYFQAYNGSRLSLTIRTGDYDNKDDDLIDYDLIISTYEKMDSILRHKASWINQCGLIVVDESHNITERKRGPTLEILLTRLRYKCPGAKLVLLSAVMSNADEIASWLGAKLFQSEWRAVPLAEGVYYNGEITWKDNSKTRINTLISEPSSALAWDIVNKGAQCLVFCNSRKKTLMTAGFLARCLSTTISQYELRALSEIATVIRDPSLASYIRQGVAFHNAGLSSHDRMIVEEGFRRNMIKAIASTTTLAAGVNLPARRVVLQTINRWDQGREVPIPKYEYSNAAGRAGRIGLDPYGESIIIAEHLASVPYLLAYLRQPNEQIISRLTEPNALHSHVLATIKLEQPIAANQVKDFFTKTFGFSQIPASLLDNLTDESLTLLNKLQLTYIKEDKYNTTLIGSKVCECYISPLSYPPILVALGEPFTIEGWFKTICSLPDFEARSNIDWPFVLNRWINEVPENEMIVQSGDLKLVVELAQWLIYSSRIVAALRNEREKAKQLEELELRVRYGIREEIISLCELKWVGRERGRAMFNLGLRNKEDVKNNPHLVERAVGHSWAQRILDNR